jgi:RNA polymerase sigma-70 factor (ECF subfamily)
MADRPRAPESPNHVENGETAFLEARALLLSVAYRMTGSRYDAEDLVQDAWLRWRATPQAAVLDPRAYLVTVVTRLAMDHFRSARVQREHYVGPWLPEPVLNAEAWLGPLETVEQREQLALAVVALYERLTPLQRAVIVLREAFAYPFDEIARVVGSSSAACRQAHRRAKAHLGSDLPILGGIGDHQRLLSELLAAFSSGDLRGLERLLAAEIVLVADGGGEVPAARRPIRGAQQVTQFLSGLLRQAPAEVRVDVADINGWPALVVEIDGTVTHVLSIAGQAQIQHIAIVRNPGKLVSVLERTRHNR